MTPGRAIGREHVTASGDRHDGRRDPARARVLFVSRVAKPFKLTAIEPTEFELQRSVADLLDWLLMPPAFYTAFPAGWGKLPPRIAGLLKACGLKRGMPDVLVFDVHNMIANRTYPKIVGIELKRPSKKTATSDEQDLMHGKLRAIGVPVYVCWKIEQVIEVLDTEGINRRPHFLDEGKYGAA
jgi:hypothetical protein